MSDLERSQADQINAQARRITDLERSQADQMNAQAQEIQSIAELMRQLQTNQGLDSPQQLV